MIILSQLESLKQLVAQRQRLVDQTILQTLDGSKSHMDKKIV